jgi:triosephosphate isomerase
VRRPIFAANWKMHMTVGEAEAFAETFLPLVEKVDSADIVIAPPFTAVAATGRLLEGSNVALAAQNVNSEPKGAFTGEIAAGMLSDLGVSYCIVGHSERRAIYHEQDDFIAGKAAALMAVGIRPIVCVGETLVEREAGRTLDVVSEQLAGSLMALKPEQAEEIVLAYEPVWAIGTGKTATPEIAQEVHRHIRSRLVERFGEAGNAMRIQYGGSVKPENVDELMAQPDIDGALVGGASLDPEAFARIVRFEPPEGAS